jgi:hypothetical protein
VAFEVRQCVVAVSSHQTFKLRASYINPTRRPRKVDVAESRGYKLKAAAEADQPRFEQHVIETGARWAEGWRPTKDEPETPETPASVAVIVSVDNGDHVETPGGPRPDGGAKKDLFGAARKSSSSAKRLMVKELLVAAGQRSKQADVHKAAEGTVDELARLERVGKRKRAAEESPESKAAAAMHALTEERTRAAAVALKSASAGADRIAAAMLSGTIAQDLMLRMQVPTRTAAGRTVWSDRDFPSTDKEILASKDASVSNAHLAEMTKRAQVALAVLAMMRDQAAHRLATLQGVLGVREKTGDAEWVTLADAAHTRAPKASVSSAAEVVVARRSLGVKISATTMARYVTQFLANGGFKPSEAGRWLRVPTIDEFGLRAPFQMWLKCRQNTHESLQCKDAAKWLGERLLKEGENSDHSEKNRATAKSLAHGGCINVSVAHAWMLDCGCSCEPTTATYYTTGHERPETLKDKEERFIPDYREHETYSSAFFEACVGDGTEAAIAMLGILDAVLHTAKMMQCADPTFPVGGTHSVADTLAAMDMRQGGRGEGAEEKYVMLHTDFLDKYGLDAEAFMKNRMEESGMPGYMLWYTKGSKGPETNTAFPQGNTAEASRRASRGHEWKCKADHDPQRCKCKNRRIILGHDECCIKQDIFKSKMWVILGKRRMLPKSEGAAEMFSTFQSTDTGFKGEPRNLPESERGEAVARGLDAVDAKLTELGIERPKWLPPRSDPMHVQFTPGKNKMGYWDGEAFQLQSTLALAYAEAVWPSCTFVILWITRLAI